MISIGPLRLGKTGIRALSEIGATACPHLYQLLSSNMESIEYSVCTGLLGHYDTVVVGGGVLAAAASGPPSMGRRFQGGAGFSGNGFRALVAPHAHHVEHLMCQRQGRGDPEQARRHHP
ncbi:MAG: hypothetical protein ACLU19_10735 [Faecalibacterium sp.]